MTYAIGLPRWPLPAFFVFFFLLLPTSSSATASLAPVEVSSSTAAPRRDRLPVGRAGCVTTEPVPSGSSLTACLSSSWWDHLPVSTLIEYSPSAGATGLEPATCGFGDRCSAS